MEKNNFRDKNGKLLISRRQLIYGAIGVGAVAAAGAGIKLVSENVEKASRGFDVLEVPTSSVTTVDKLQETNSFFKMSGEVKLPYRSLLWANNSNVITCLIPTNKAKPLANVVLIHKQTKNQIIVKEKAQLQKEGFDIYDVRANDKGIIWTEINLLQGQWCIYCSKFNDNYNINPKLVDKGDSNWEVPSLGISDNYCYWQCMPSLNGDKQNLNSFVKQTNFNNIGISTLTEDIINNDDLDTFFSSEGRMSSPIYSCNDGIVISPKADKKLSYNIMTYLNNKGNIQDKIALPQNVKPLHCAYGNTGFNFSLDAIYNDRGGFSNIGTYIPYEKDNYNKGKWLNFSRTPTAAPCWSNQFLIIRSTMSVCTVNLENNSYCIIERPNASDEYGEYLASSGNCDTFVTYSSILDRPITGEEQKYCLMRIWEKN